MSKEELKQTMINAESRIHEEIRKLYPSSAGLDGIISIDDYLDTKNTNTNPLKILWVLKERGYPCNKINQEFVISEYMKCLGEYPKWRDTYGPMCYVTEGLLEWQRTKDDKFLDFKNLFELRVASIEEGKAVYYNWDNKKDSPQVFPLDHIAFLNVKKLGWYKNTSDQTSINKEYEKPEVKKILKEQFDYINPDIIIFGNRVKKIAEDFAGVPFSKYTHVGEYGALDYYFDNIRNKLFIFANHPSAIPPHNQDKEDYTNSIFNVIKMFKNKLLQ